MTHQFHYEQDWKGWGSRFKILSFRGELPLPEDLSQVQGDVTKRIRNVVGITTKIPKEFCGTFNVDGHKVHVFRHGETPLLGKRRYFHRVFIEVVKGAPSSFVNLKNECLVTQGAQLVPIGRLWQKFNKPKRQKRGRR